MSKTARIVSEIGEYTTNLTQFNLQFPHSRNIVAQIQDENGRMMLALRPVQDIPRFDRGATGRGTG